MRFTFTRKGHEFSHYSLDDPWDTVPEGKPSNDSRVRNPPIGEETEDTKTDKQNTTMQKLPKVTLSPKPSGLEETIRTVKDLDPTYFRYQHYTMDSAEPVWKKRLRKVEADRKTLYGKGDKRKSSELPKEEVVLTRPMQTISVENTPSSDDSCLSHPSVAQGEKTNVYSMSGTTSSVVSGLSSSVSGLFQRVGPEDDAFSLETPSCPSVGESSVEVSRTAFDADRSAISSMRFHRNRRSRMQRDAPSFASRSSRSMGESSTSVQSSVDEAVYGCFADSTVADDFDLFTRLFLGQVSCGTCLNEHSEMQVKRKRGNHKWLRRIDEDRSLA